MVQLPTLLYLFMNFLEIKPCIQHCKFWGLCLEGVSGKERKGTSEGEGEGRRQNCGFYRHQNVEDFIVFIILWIAFSVEFIISLRLQFIFLLINYYHNFLSHYNMTHKHTTHVEQTSVLSNKIILSIYFPPFSHYRSIFMFYFGVVWK